MYGLVNQSLQGYVINNSGEKVWSQIVLKSGVMVEEFDAMETYPDDVTYRLVGAACEIMGMSPEDLLYGFGLHWMVETGPKHYGQYLEMCGSDFVGFLGSLDAMHSRIQLVFPHLDPPSFSVTNVEEGALSLEYMSNRPGLEYFVRGLIAGVALKTNVEVTVKDTKPLESSPHGVIFSLTFA